MSFPRLMASALLACLALTACRASIAQWASTASGAVATVPADQRERWETRPELQRHFTELGTKGTLVLLDTRAHRWIASDSVRAFEGFLPASTFKIPMSLIALETGAAVDETQAFKWDGTKRRIEDWNHDQTLASAYQVSAVWVFQSLARQIGQPTVQQFVRDFRYGNAVAGPIGDRFWLDGDMRISSVGQIEFLRRVHDRALPLSDRTYDIARQVMLRDQGPGWRLYAKTGWADSTRPGLGWFVGWVEQDRDARPVYFALNMDMTDPAFSPKRAEIVHQVLRSMGALEER
ncbi:class D beta-lactamase [Roseateles sp. UC29_93]|uniref:class D beta-lactamase n=1 Tax=Roseateles sp. UC29_93 TaxID=3350177 RepID=UPI003672E77E